MIPLTLKALANAIDGELILPKNIAEAKTETEDTVITGETIINHISTDSRTIGKGHVFLALKGDNFDAHSFVEQVTEQGCVATIVEYKNTTKQVSLIAQIIVKDTHKALGQIGAYIKEKVAPKTVAITGSSGKTTVKEMTCAILAQLGKVLATKGNFNNDIGVPLTLMRLEKEHEFAVIELGANHQGEIAYTSNLVKPDVALINNIAPAHLAGFGDLNGVAVAKSEIFSGLKKNGIGIFSQESVYAQEWQQLLINKNYYVFSTKIDESAVLKGFEQQKHLICWSENETLSSNGYASFTLKSHIGAIDISLPIPGKHNIDNAIAAAAIAFSFGASLQNIKQGLMKMAPVKGRLNTIELNDKFTLVDDTYNANVDSVKVASELLASFKGNKILILGDMGELGDEAEKYHYQVGAYANKTGVDVLLTLGELSQHISNGFLQCKNENISSEVKVSHHFTERKILLNYFTNLITDLITTENEIEQDQTITVLVKGSRSAHMEDVVADIKQWYKDCENNNNKSNNANEKTAHEVSG